MTITEIQNNPYQYNSLWQASAHWVRVVGKGFDDDSGSKLT